MPLAILIVLISIFSLTSLKKLYDINYSIINTDAPLIDAADKLIENLIAQELYGRRYVILKSPDTLALFWKRSEEFGNIVENLRTIPGQKHIPIDNMVSLHKEYNDIFIKGLEHLGTPSSARAKDYDSRIRNKQDELIKLIKTISLKARNDQNKKVLFTTDVGAMAFWITALISGFGIVFGIGAAILITRNIAGSINTLKIATKEVAEGRFEYRHNIKNRDELGELSDAFSEMTKRLQRLEEMYLDMSPLTRLPGGLAIENVLKKRLSSNTPMAFCLIDMDNFKSFNDRYGYVRGNDVIKATAEIIESAVKEHGTVEDFVGHIGGDDFVVISSPDRYVKICKTITAAFDRRIPDFYDPEDRDRGHIAGKTRQGQEIAFPIVTISIAVVTNQQRPFADPAQVGEIAAELKAYAKSISGSIYVVDKRRDGAQMLKQSSNPGAHSKGTNSEKEVKDA
jgi:GGDEF domain-containing protein